MTSSTAKLLVLVGSICASTAVAAEKPNFIVIFADDQGYQDLGCYGSPQIKTPRIDQMAGEGMKFTSFYAQTVCGPSRAAIMTGCYPLRVAQKNNVAEIHPVLHAKEITIAEVLKTVGYHSACFGKWDLAKHSQRQWHSELLPPGQGFDYFFGTPTSNDSVVHLIRGTGVIERNADMSTLTRRYTDEVIRFIEENKDGPFFAYIPHTMPHTRLAVSEQFKGKSAGGLYGDVIEEIDFNVGRILDKVKALGIDDNTYIFYTSDNGPWLIKKQHGGHAAPLRSGKTTWWEGGHRVPFIVRAPGKVPAGKTCDQVASTLDILPTLAKLAGAKTPHDRVIDGQDISRLIHGSSEPLNSVYFYYQHTYLRAVRKGPWKLVLKHEEPPGTGIMQRWKAHLNPATDYRIAEHMLFNLDKDVGESNDVAAKHPDVVEELLELATWAREDIGDYNKLGKRARFFDDAPKRLETAQAKANK